MIIFIHLSKNKLFLIIILIHNYLLNTPVRQYSLEVIRALDSLV